MAKPELPMAITLADLIKCQQGDIIVSMLIDAKAFFDYDQRENGQTLEVYDDFWYAVFLLILCLSFTSISSNRYAWSDYCLLYQLNLNVRGNRPNKSILNNSQLEIKQPE